LPLGHNFDIFKPLSLMPNFSWVWLNECKSIDYKRGWGWTRAVCRWWWWCKASALFKNSNSSNLHTRISLLDTTRCSK